METPGLEFQKKTTRYNVVEANFFTAHKVSEAGFDVIDLHYYSLLQTFRRNRDGIHWSPEANRYVTNLLFTHVALSEGKSLPGRNQDDYALARTKFMADIAQGKLQSDQQVQDKILELNKIAAKMTSKKLEEHDCNTRPQLRPIRELQTMAANAFPSVTVTPDQQHSSSSSFQSQQGQGSYYPTRQHPYQHQDHQGHYMHGAMRRDPGPGPGPGLGPERNMLMTLPRPVGPSNQQQRQPVPVFDYEHGQPMGPQRVGPWGQTFRNFRNNDNSDNQRGFGVWNDPPQQQQQQSFNNPMNNINQQQPNNSMMMRMNPMMYQQQLQQHQQQQQQQPQQQQMNRPNNNFGPGFDPGPNNYGPNNMNMGPNSFFQGNNGPNFNCDSFDGNQQMQQFNNYRFNN
jgi:hypothetical protein